MSVKIDQHRQSRQKSIEMDKLELQDNKSVLAASREYEASKKKYVQDHWTEELAQHEKLKGGIIKGNDIVTKLK